MHSVALSDDGLEVFLRRAQCENRTRIMCARIHISGPSTKCECQTF
jgi:hypothetical protein